MKKIDFLLVGAQKSGTSAMDLYLREHSQINMAKVKECHYFDNDHTFERAINYKDYHNKFSVTSGVKLLGESTPNYMYWVSAIERIYKYNPNIKIVAVLRNPIKRAFSAWNMEKNRGIEGLSFFRSHSS